MGVMAVEKVEKIEKESRASVKMKFVGHFRGTHKAVALPIPLISNSQKLDKELVFERSSERQGPAYCDVPMEWVGALMSVGGNWQVVDKLTPELQTEIAKAKETCDARMKTFALENQTVEA
jgi:hypothetical protein